MRIAVIGAGAMGSIYGGRLSLHNEVYMVDTSAAVVDHISREGICLEEPDGVHVYRPKAVTSTEGLEPVDLIVLFVKSLYSKAALSGNPCLIGPDTYILTLQNGCGHEDILSEFVPRERIIIGTTQDNGAALGPGHVRRGGTGHTNVGMLTGDDKRFFPRMAEAFGSCGFELEIHSDIRQLIWNKLFTNVSLSAVTAILQVDMGYITSNAHAWNMTVQLIHEAAAVARAMGLEADDEAIIAEIKAVSERTPRGCTSIRADLRDGRRSEVDTISGSVVRAAQKYGVAVPTHRFVVEMVHAMEERERQEK